MANTFRSSGELDVHVIVDARVAPALLNESSSAIQFLVAPFAGCRVYVRLSDDPGPKGHSSRLVTIATTFLNFPFENMQTSTCCTTNT